jgi:hypothetical protein
MADMSQVAPAIDASADIAPLELNKPLNVCLPISASHPITYIMPTMEHNAAMARVSGPNLPSKP